MISIQRSLVRRFRAVLRKCPTPAYHSHDPFVVLRAGRKGLSLEAALTESALRLEHPGRYDEEVLAFPASVLARIEGRSDDLVTLGELKPGQRKACWSDGGTQVSQEFATVRPDPHLCFRTPSPPRWIEAGNDFLTALADASQTAAKYATGRNLQCVLLRGGKGQMVATDGRQLLCQDGFKFPWSEDVLVPRIDAWCSRELPSGEGSRIGRTEKHACVGVGPWTIALAVNADGRFPPFETIIPPLREVKTRLRLTPTDVAFLKKELPRLIAARDPSAPAVLQVGERVTIHPESDAESKEGQELELPSASVSGPPIRLVVNARLLLRAVQLGFIEVEVIDHDRPLCCRDSYRTYVWISQGAPKPDVTPEPPATSSSPEPTQQKKEKSIMPENNGRHADHGVTPATPIDPLAEAEAIRALLAEAHAKASRLVAVLKLHRKQARAVRAAVDSLRQLPPLAP